MKPKHVHKPWGWELWFAHSRHYVGKILLIRKGHRLSKQLHRVKHETIYTEKGCWQLEIGKRRRVMRPGSMVVIPPGTVHRMTAGKQDVRLLEVSTPQVSDVVRLEDDYGRIPRA